MMRKVLAVILAAVIMISGGVALASNDTKAEGTLVIEGKRTYEGMPEGMSYEKGYQPAGKAGGHVSITLPLTPTGNRALLGNPVLKLNVADPGSSPISSLNVATAMKPDEKFGDGTLIGILNLSLKADALNGVYPANFTASYNVETEPGSGKYTLITQDFVIYFEVTGGAEQPVPTEPVVPSPEPEPPVEKPTSQPKLIIQKFIVSPEAPVAGKEFDLTMVFKNTSTSMAVKNIKITVKADEGNILPVDSGTLYFASIARGRAVEATMKFQVRPDTPAKPQGFTVTMEYEDTKTTAISMVETLAVPITQEIRFQIGEPVVPETVFAGESFSVTLDLFNLGKSTIYNVMCKIEGEGLTPESDYFAGNMEPGTQKAMDIYVSAGGSGGMNTFPGMARPMIGGGISAIAMTAQTEAPFDEATADDMPVEDVPADDAPVEDVPIDEGEIIIEPGIDKGESGGPVNGRVLITYEDEYGNQFSETREFTTYIMEMSFPEEPIPEEPMPEQSGGSLGLIIGIVVGIAAIIALIIVLVKRARKRKAMFEDELD
ncbi:MAG: COG1361 S-layer family protein [Christensenellales bacterium]|jgi:hypothetical protein